MKFFALLEQRYWPFYYALGTMLLFFSLPLIQPWFFNNDSSLLGEYFDWKNAVYFLSIQILGIIALRVDTPLRYVIRVVLMGYFMGGAHYFYNAAPFLQKPLPTVGINTEIEKTQQVGNLSLLTCLIKNYPHTELKRILVLVQGNTDKKVGDDVNIITPLIPLKIPFPGLYQSERYRLQGVQAQTPVLSVFFLKSLGMKDHNSIIEKIQTFMTNKIQKALGRERIASVGIVKAFVLGNTAEIPPSVKKNFAYAGLSHLLAISGLHMTIIIGIIYGLLRFLLGWVGFFFQQYAWRKMLMLIAVAVGGIYVLISGANPPALRAYGMACMILLGMWTDHPITSQQRLLSSVGILLLINPFFILMPSFQLSFMAVWGLVNLEKSSKKKNFFFQSIIITARATIATLPLCMYYFDQIPVYTLFANILAVPLVSFIIMPLIGWVLLVPAHGFVLNEALTLLQNIALFFAKEVGITLQAPYLSLMQALLLTLMVGIGFVVPQKDRWKCWISAIGILLFCTPSYKMLVIKDQQGILYPGIKNKPDILWVKDLHNPLMVHQLLKYTQCSKAVVRKQFSWDLLEKKCPNGCFASDID